MTRKEMIAKFNLKRTKTQALFQDGMTTKSRSLYIGDRGNMFVFYDNDLHAVEPLDEYVDGMETIPCYLCMGYSCYR